MKKATVLVAHGFVGWAFCAALMGVGPLLVGMSTTLLLHLVLGPLGFGLLSLFYGRRFGYTSPLPTAVFFLLFVAAMDFFFVGLVILGSLEMFTSIIGIWLPFSLIFLLSWVAGHWAERERAR